VGGTQTLTDSNDRIINIQERPAPQHGPVDAYPTLGSPILRTTISTTIDSYVYLKTKCLDCWEAVFLYFYGAGYTNPTINVSHPACGL
jgi:hypothetical protein